MKGFVVEAPGQRLCPEGRGEPPPTQRHLIVDAEGQAQLTHRLTLVRAGACLGEDGLRRLAFSQRVLISGHPAGCF